MMSSTVKVEGEHCHQDDESGAHIVIASSTLLHHTDSP